MNKTPSFASEIEAAEAIVDIFSKAVDEGIETISTREIMSFLGMKLIDKKDNKEYDLKGITRNNIAKYTDAMLEQFKL